MMSKPISQWIKRILIIALGALVVIQFFQIDKTNPVTDSGKDLLNSSLVSAEVKTLVQDACYDCHSYKTKYPWYTYVAPVNFWIKKHIDEGRKHLNFSIWQEYEPKRQHHKLEECVEEIKEAHMPLRSYTWMHPEAKLSNDEIETLLDYFARKMKAME